jgi:hypothetical protein
MTPSWCLLRFELHLQPSLLAQSSLRVRVGESHRPPRSRSNLQHHEKPCFACCQECDLKIEEKIDGVDPERKMLLLKGFVESVRIAMEVKKGCGVMLMENGERRFSVWCFRRKEILREK